MIKKGRISLSILLSTFYTIAAFLFFGIFILILLFASNNMFQKLNEGQLGAYFYQQKEIIQTNEGVIKDHPYNCFFNHEYIKNKNGVYIKNDKFDNWIDKVSRVDETKNLSNVLNYIVKNIDKIINDNLKGQKDENTKLVSKTLKYHENKKTYTILFDIIQKNKDRKNIQIIGAFTDEEFIKENKKKTVLFFLIGLIIILVLINIFNYLIIYFLIAKRLNKLSDDVINLPKHNYQKPVTIIGKDEITNLCKNVDKLRSELFLSEIAKRDMLQNMSHDIKNPIGIIKSYAEAIYDGVADIESINVILEKADELSKRIAKLINYIKAEYLEEKSKSYKEFLIKPIIENLVSDNKFRFSGDIICNLDNSKYFGDTEKFSIAIQNILENSLRYAKNKIEINLNKKRLTIYNDGPTIDPEFIDSMFTLYQKSNDGSFGIGLSITKVTLLKFGLDISAKNLENGVVFTIFPI